MPKQSPTKRASKSRTKRSSSGSAKKLQRKQTDKRSRRSKAVVAKAKQPSKRGAGKTAPVSRQKAKPSLSTKARQPVVIGRAKIAKVNPIRTASIKHYETAVKLLYSHQYDKAKIAFEKIIATFSDDKEVLERTRLHLRLCEQKIARKPPAPRTLDEHYNLAVALMNEGRYDESQDHLQRALKSNPRCDYVLYALAANNCRQGDLESALGNLQSAISLKPENRFLAQRDSDFEVLKQDSRFVSLVFPERTPASTY